MLYSIQHGERSGNRAFEDHDVVAVEVGTTGAAAMGIPKRRAAVEVAHTHSETESHLLFWLFLQPKTTMYHEVQYKTTQKLCAKLKKRMLLVAIVTHTQ